MGLGRQAWALNLLGMTVTVSVVAVTVVRMAVDRGGRVDRGKSSKSCDAGAKGNALKHLMEYDYCKKSEEEGVASNNQGNADYCDAWSAVVHRQGSRTGVTYE